MEDSDSMTTKISKMAVTIALSVALFAGIVGGALAFAGRTKPVAASTGSAVVQGSALVSVRLPGYIGRPASIAVATDGTAWFWADSNGEADLFHWDPATSSLSSVNLGTPASLGLVTGIESAVVVDKSGNIWVGANHSLVSYNPSNGATTHITIPPTGTVTGLNADVPSQLENAQAIDAMSAGPTGSVAIAIR